MSMERYNTRSRAEIPRRMYLVDPVTFESTEDYLDVISSLSDSFAEARDEALSVVADSLHNSDKEERKKISKECQLSIQASLVVGWSFDKEFTKENVVDFLRNSRSVLNSVINLADDRKSFFCSPSTDSMSGPSS